MNAFVISAFLMGLFGGVHCVTMCGGVVGVLCGASPRCPSARSARPGAAASARRMSYWAAYNGGRIGSYALLGLLFGGLGSLSTGVFPLEPMRFALRAFAGVCMLGVGLHLAGLPSLVRAIEGLGAPLWAKLAPSAKRFLPLRSPRHAVVLGALWGLMPCGLLYSALALAASTESGPLGMITMASFGIATLPLMLTMGAMAQGITRWLARAWVRRAVGALVLAFGLWSSVGLAAQARLGAPLGLAPRCCPTR